MRWKTTPDGQNIQAGLLADWLIGRHEDTVLMQLRHQSADEQGSAQMQDLQVALPVALAEQLAAQILECIRSGEVQQGAPPRTEQ